jgi:peptide-methionine (S)-S-oxide reductase
MEAVFPTSAQLAIAKARVTAPIIEGARFYVAEDYHQKYYLRHDSTLMRELADYTPAQLRESVVAARLNGYVAGRGTAARLAGEIASFGLSADATKHLERVVARR